MNGGKPTTYDVASQAAQTISNVGGDHTVYFTAGWQSLQLRTEIERAMDEVARIPLESEARAWVDGALTAAASGAAAPNGDRHRVAELLAAAAATLREAGAFANAGTGLAVALRRAAALLGPLGAGILALL